MELNFDRLADGRGFAVGTFCWCEAPLSYCVDSLFFKAELFAVHHDNVGSAAVYADGREEVNRGLELRFHGGVGILCRWAIHAHRKGVTTGLSKWSYRSGRRRRRSIDERVELRSEGNDGGVGGQHDVCGIEVFQIGVFVAMNSELQKQIVTLRRQLSPDP